MRARVSPEELAGGSLVKPNWYGCSINKYEEREASTDRSTNGIFYFTVLHGEFKGARARILINEKAWSFTPNPNLLVALGAEPKPEIGLDVNIDEKTVVGRKLDVYISRTTSQQGKEFNTPQDFAPIGRFSGFEG